MSGLCLQESTSVGAELKREVREVSLGDVRPDMDTD